MKQTAVEWLVDKLEIFATEEEMNIIQQAKEMEKEQIIKSYCQGCFDISKDESIFPRETSEQYYKETFKSE